MFSDQILLWFPPENLREDADSDWLRGGPWHSQQHDPSQDGKSTCNEIARQRSRPTASRSSRQEVKILGDGAAKDTKSTHTPHTPRPIQLYCQQFNFPAALLNVRAILHFNKSKS